MSDQMVLSLPDPGLHVSGAGDAQRLRQAVAMVTRVRGFGVDALSLLLVAYLLPLLMLIVIAPFAILFALMRGLVLSIAARV